MSYSYCNGGLSRPDKMISLKWKWFFNYFAFDDKKTRSEFDLSSKSGYKKFINKCVYSCALKSAKGYKKSHNRLHRTYNKKVLKQELEFYYEEE